MAYDEGLAEVLREDLAEMQGLSERKMFGGLCLMLDGNMLCGIHKSGGMFRVGKALHEQALAIEGVTPMAFTGRPMGGMVDVDDEAMADEVRRGEVMALALEFVQSLPAK
jgi:hypothetical protein